MGIKVYNGDGSLKMASGASYDGSKTGTDLTHWNEQSVHPSEFILETYDKLAARCATLYNTSSLARAMVRKPIAYSIGRGIFFRSLPNWKMLGMDKEQATEWGRKFTMLLHFDKLAVNHYAKQYDLMAEASITGDSLLFFVPDSTGKPFDLVTASGALIIDSDKNQAPAGDTAGYTLGVKHDKFMRRTGFWARGEQKEFDFVDSQGNRNALMFMLRERSSQTRGYSVIYPMVALLKNLDRAWDATFERMVQESIQLGWITANPNDVKQQAAGMAAAARGRRIHSNEGTGFKDYGGGQTPGGMYIWENKDYQINFTDLKTPSNNFSNAQIEARRSAGMSRGVGPGFLLGEYEKSFTAHKGELNDTMKTVYYERQRYVEQIENNVNLEYLKHYVRTGMLEVMPGFWDNHYIQQAYLSGKWIGEVPGHINPNQEVAADVARMANGGLLRSDFAASNGYSDFEAFLDEREEQERRFMTLDAEQLAKEIVQNEEEISE